MRNDKVEWRREEEGGGRKGAQPGHQGIPRDPNIIELILKHYAAQGRRRGDLREPLASCARDSRCVRRPGRAALIHVARGAARPAEAALARVVPRRCAAAAVGIIPVARSLEIATAIAAVAPIHRRLAPFQDAQAYCKSSVQRRIALI